MMIQSIRRWLSELLRAERSESSPPIEALLSEARAARDGADWPRAREVYAGVLAKAPDHPEALLALANIAYLTAAREDAIGFFERYLAIEPSNLQARNILARIHGDLGELRSALREYRRIVDMDPGFEQVAHLALLLTAFDPDMDGPARRKEHEAWAQRNVDHLAEPAPARVAVSRRHRVGYVSAFFCNHPIADFVAPILRHHDRIDWEVFVYSDVPTGDEVTRSLRGLEVRWRDCAGMDDAAFSAQVRADELDVLIDLAGHNATNRLRAFARRLAPVQITGIGYAGTTGMSAMDYRLADPVADLDTDGHYTEKLLRLPGGLWCYEPHAMLPEPGRGPREAHGYVTFASLNASIKLSQPTLDAWARLLNRVPDSKLLFATVVPGLPRDRLRRHFADQHIDPSRIEFEPPMSRASFWTLYARSDIALDTWPCNGGTTTFEALWGGVPVVTMEGTEFRSRAGAAILRAAGLPELVEANVDDYVERAAALAQDRSRLANLRAQLRGRLRSSGLLDGQRYTRELEQCYRQALGARA